jgi:hypothetical protein
MGRIILPPSLLGVKSRQQIGVTFTGTALTTLDTTITSVDLNNSMLLTDGLLGSVAMGDVAISVSSFRAQLTSATNLRIQKNTVFSVSPTLMMAAQVIEFNAGVVKNLRRGTFTYTGTNVGVTTLQSTGSIFTALTNRDKCIINSLGYTASAVSNNASNVDDYIKKGNLVLNSALDGFDFRTSDASTGVTYTVSYEVVEFL